MRVLVTGASGFIGRHLARRLLRSGDIEVHALVRAGSNRERIDSSIAAADATRLHLHEAEIELAAIRRVIMQSRPDTVLHLASLNVSQHQPEQIEDLVRVNILLPALLLECLADAGCARFVNMGSAWQHFSGQHYDPVCLYAASKQSCEDFLAFYQAAHGISSISLKLFHAYGPGDARPRLLMLLCRAAVTGEVLPMSNGHQFVDYVHVDDVVEAILVADRLLATGRVTGAASYAIPSGRSMTVRDLVALVGDVAGRPIPVEWGRLLYKQREIMQPISCGPILPSWSPSVELVEGIGRLLAEEWDATSI